MRIRPFVWNFERVDDAQVTRDRQRIPGRPSSLGPAEGCESLGAESELLPA
jgi:hypothetical protein